MLCPTVQWLVSWVSNSPMLELCFFQLSNAMVGKSCVQLSKGRIMLCQTVLWLDSAVSNSPMVSECWVKLPAKSSTVKRLNCALSNIWTVLCPTVQLLVYAVSNCPMACELSVQLSNGWTVLFQTVKLLSSALSKTNSPMVEQLLSSCPMVGQCCVQQSIHSFEI